MTASRALLTSLESRARRGSTFDDPRRAPRLVEPSAEGGLKTVTGLGVDAGEVDDDVSMKLARDIAIKIEDEMVTFPGEIKVTVLREVRSVEYAISGRHRSE